VNEENRFSIGQTMKFCQPKLKIIPRRRRSKLLNIWVVKEIRVDAKIEIEESYSRKNSCYSYLNS